MALKSFKFCMPMFLLLLFAFAMLLVVEKDSSSLVFLRGQTQEPGGLLNSVVPMLLLAIQLPATSTIHHSFKTMIASNHSLLHDDDDDDDEAKKTKVLLIDEEGEEEEFFSSLARGLNKVGKSPSGGKNLAQHSSNQPGVTPPPAPPTNAITMVPSFLPSTRPSLARMPTIAPTPAPSPPPPCGRFQAFANSGAANIRSSSLIASLTSGNGDFSFLWRGIGEPYTFFRSSNGMTSVDLNYIDQNSISPIELGGAYSVPRIAVAQGRLNFTFTEVTNPTIYVGAGTLRGETVYFISWEGLSFQDADPSLYSINFQAILYQAGGVELRWGSGQVPPGESVVAGIESDSAGFATPATGPPFGAGGVSSPGVWPTNQCRSFWPVNGIYVQTSSG